ncbi:MAG: DUF1499 domain-containing protein [Deinococcales bacterium]
MLRWLILFVIVLVVAFLILRYWLIPAQSPTPPPLADRLAFIKDGGKLTQLAACGAKPNCVSSFAEGEAYIAPLSYEDDQEKAKERLKATLAQMPRASLVFEAENYVHIVFRSRMMGFFDDAEGLFDDAEKKIYLRSAARLGYSDLDANRRYLEKLSQNFYQQTPNLDHLR